MEKVEPFYPAGWDEKWCNHFGKPLTVSQKVKHTPVNFTTKYILMRNENMCLQNKFQKIFLALLSII